MLCCVSPSHRPAFSFDGTETTTHVFHTFSLNVYVSDVEIRVMLPHPTLPLTEGDGNKQCDLCEHSSHQHQL